MAASYRILILTLLSFVYQSIPSKGQCSYGLPWINVWPNDKVELIQPQQIFRFISNSNYSFVDMPKEVSQFGHETEIYLWSAHDSVSLAIIDKQPEANKLTEMLLRPERPLLLGNVYELKIRRDTTNLFSLFMNKSERPRSTIYRWQVTTTPDAQAPTWLATPVIVEKKYSTNSEGINNYVIFSNPLQDSSACLIKVTIQHADGSQKTTTYINSVPDGQLAIGWFTCGGEIRFKPAEWYNITFEAIDAAGNRATASGTAVSFQAPARPPKLEWQYRPFD